MPDLIPREMWKGKPPLRATPLDCPARRIFFAYTYSLSCQDTAKCASTLRNLQHLEMTMNNREDLQYNFMLGSEGGVYIGRGWDARPSLPKRFSQYDGSSYYFAFIGKPKGVSSVEMQLFHQLKSQLIDFGVKYNYIANDYTIHELLR